MPREPIAPFDAFNRDVQQNTGYLYTTNASLSSELSNRRLTDATLAAVDFRQKRVVDIGCGDGTYTIDLFDRGHPCSIHGTDPARAAIIAAREKIGARQIEFDVHSAYALPWADNAFDLAHVRGVLHHLERPQDALREALRVASTVLIIEPNGLNIGLKVIERVSSYHREHQEKSYSPSRIDKWVRQLGGRVTSRQWVGLVPFFCPNWIARSLKRLEPLVEAMPVGRRFGCGQYVAVATRDARR